MEIPLVSDSVCSDLDSVGVTSIKEGVLLRNVSAAPISDHFAVLPPCSRIREVVPFLV